MRRLRSQPLPDPTTGRKLAVLVLSLLAGFAAMSIVFAANRVNPLFALKEILFRSFVDYLPKL